MVGDMFNAGLQSRVNSLCSELSSLLASQNVFAPVPRQDFGAGSIGVGSSVGGWWPSELGSPSSSGGQNDAQYAYFPHARRLAIREAGRMALYDTLDHRIGGVQQQQGGGAGSLSFSSQYGTFSVASLPLAPESPSLGPSPIVDPAPSAHQPAPAHEAAPAGTRSFDGTPAVRSDGGGRRTPEEILAAIERLADLHRKGVLTDSEFQAKKADLLAQL
jgi:hypothetical protein